VLVLSPDFPPSFGGIQLLVHRLVRHWERVQPLVVTLDAEASAEFDAAQPFPVRRNPHRKAAGRSSAVALLDATSVWLARRFRPHVVLSGHIVTSPAAWAIKRFLGRPYVQYLHGREVVIRPRLSTFGIRHAAAVVAVSRYTESLAHAHGAEPERVNRIPPGVDLPSHSATRRASRPTVVTVARLEQRYKGHDLLIRALPLVRARVPDVRLAIVGDGPLRAAYENLASGLGVSKSIEFLGSLDDEARDRVLAASHVFAMPSRLPLDGGGEGFGIVYLEAGACNLPVVAGNEAGALDAVVNGETGILVDPHDHVALARALADLLADPERATRLGRANAERARDFAWPGVARRVEDLLVEVAPP
jgi:phosphatidylinositol alpha-1,6-mannosyltransferase